MASPYDKAIQQHILFGEMAIHHKALIATHVFRKTATSVIMP